MTKTVVGIDLGTTNTVVAAVRDGQASALPGEDGQVLIPSVVSFHPSGTVLVGRDAKARRKVDAVSTIYSVKRLIGRSWGSDEVRQARSRFPFEMREGPGQAALVVARKETYTLPEISAFVLRKAKTVAERALGAQVDRAVITVPANFNDLQRAATKVAGRVAGLEVMRIVNEPTAAALAYGYGKASSERIAVYDFGGGTLDITLLDLSDNVFEVLATAGDTFLGGDDIDLEICERMADELLASHRIDARADPAALELLRAAAEDLKQQLSQDAHASVTISEIGHGPGGRAFDFSFALSRSELEQLIQPIVARTFDVCREAMGIARLQSEDFSQVLLVGGSTRIPLVRKEVERFFKRAPVTSLNPDEVVAIGAAIQASALSGAEKRRSTLPLPPSPAARGGQRPRLKTVPPADTASYGRPRLRTAPGLQPSSPGPFPTRQRRAPVVVPPAAGQPSSGTPITQDRADRAKRTTAIGLGTAPTGQPLTSRDLPPGMTRTGRGLGPPGPALTSQPGSAPIRERSTLKSASEDAKHARARWEELPPGSSRALSPDAMANKYGDLPLVMPPATTPAGGGEIELLDDSDLEDISSELYDAGTFDDDDEETQARRPPPPVQESVAVDDEPTQVRPLPALEAVPPAVTPPLELAAPQQEPQPGPPAPGPFAPPFAAPAPDSSPPSSPPLNLPAPGIPGQPHADGTPPMPGAAEQARGTLQWGSGEPVIREAPPEPPLLIDVTPLTLAVETVGGYCDTVIERNSPIPCEKSRQFATVLDDQESVRVRVSQGEAQAFAQNTLLGEVVLSGLRKARRGDVKIEVNFALDASGILSVNAIDLGTGRSVSTRIHLVGLTEGTDVDAMRRRQAAATLA